jgi:predicted nucleic acid-binding protein
MKEAPGTIGKRRQTTRETHPEVFTVRDMNRDTAAVLEACRQHGQVVIRHRSGERFAITVLKKGGVAGSEARSPQRIRQACERIARHRARMQAMGMRGPATREGIEHPNRIIAGDVLVWQALPEDELEATFETLAYRHTATGEFRTYDLLHVAAALVLGCDSFWSFDARACRLAKLAGLKTQD